MTIWKEMKAKQRVILSILIILSVLLAISHVACAASDVEIDLTDNQRQSIAMLNYLTVLSMEINESRNSRLFLENAYSKIIENTHPNAVDYRTQDHLSDLLDILKRYRMNITKRERLEYIYEQNQAKAIKAAVPNPIGLLSSVQSLNPMKLVTSVVYMAIDSAASYYAATEENKSQFIQSGWELDDIEREALDETREEAFEYMLEIVRENDLPGDLALSEDAVHDFVMWKNHSNVVQKIQFFETHKKTYQEYGGYWLALATAYYENQDYEKCIDAVITYEKKNPRILRKDYDYAAILPLAVNAVWQTKEDDNESAQLVEKWLNAILSNTKEEDWALRFFAGESFLRLYKTTKNTDYLKQAYEIELNNVNYLVNKQREDNTKYLSDLVEEKVPDGSTNEKRKEIEEYNRALRADRKTELPPVYEPFIINCDFLFEIVKSGELDLPEEELVKINSIIHQNYEPILLNDILDSRYWISIIDGKCSFEKELKHQEFEVRFNGHRLCIPAFLVTNDSSITATMPDGTVYDEWEIEVVDRSDMRDFSSYLAIYYCKDLEGYIYNINDRVRIDIDPMKGTSKKKYRLDFEAVSVFKSIIPIPPFNLFDNVEFQPAL